MGRRSRPDAELRGIVWKGFLDSPPHHDNVDATWATGGAGKFGIFRRDDGRIFVTHVFATRR